MSPARLSAARTVATLPAGSAPRAAPRPAARSAAALAAWSRGSHPRSAASSTVQWAGTLTRSRLPPRLAAACQ
eukprot:7696375-Lingulodinium_polyedra.AAC.1